MEDKWGFVIIGAAVMILVALFFTGYIDKFDNDKIVDERASITNVMHQAIDPISPTLIVTAHTNCVARSADWYDEETKTGCYNMPSGSFDSTNCLTNPVYIQMGNLCSGIDATWICTANDVGCHY